jgi:CO/xanthine dehydrogenase FAD-binding subunit
MPREWSWFRPSGVGEAAELLEAHGDKALLIAGGTALCLNPPRRDKLALIDLQKAGLATIEEGEDLWRLGSMVTARDIGRHPSLRELWSGILPQTTATMGPQPVRNRVTLGGNVMQTFRWSDLPVALLALDARFLLAGPGQSVRPVGADELLEKQPRRLLRQGELLQAVEVPKSGPNQAGAFLKFALSRVDHALASVAVSLTLAGEGPWARCEDLRLVAGALAPLPQRLLDAEQLLRGRVLDEQSLAEAAEASCQCRMVADRRADADYQRDLLRVLVRRAVRQAWHALKPEDREAGDVG